MSPKSIISFLKYYVYYMCVYVYNSGSATQSCLTLWLHSLQHARLLCPPLSLRVCLNSCPLSQWCHPAISSSTIAFSYAFNLPQHQGLFNESALCIRWPKYWSFSFSISPSNNIQDWFPLGYRLVGSLCSPRGSQESSPTPQFKSISSSVFNFLYGPTLTSIHDY